MVKYKNLNHKPFPSSLALICHQPVNKKDDTQSIDFVVLQTSSQATEYLIHSF